MSEKSAPARSGAAADKHERDKQDHPTARPNGRGTDDMAVVPGWEDNLARGIEAMVLRGEVEAAGGGDDGRRKDDIREVIAQCRNDHDRRVAQMRQLRRKMTALRGELDQAQVRLFRLAEADARSTELCAEKICQRLGVEPCPASTYAGEITGRPEKRGAASPGPGDKSGEAGESSGSEKKKSRKHVHHGREEG